MVCIRRSGESGLTQGVLFPLHYHQTIQGTISRFTFYWPTFGFPLTSANFLGCDNHRVSLRQLQISHQDNYGIQRKFAFSRRFIRESVGTPVGIPSISSNHWIHCLAPFILDLGSSRTSDCVRLCYSDHPFGY